jgi:hypothetical protein
MSGMGVLPFPFTEMEAYNRSMGSPLSGYDLLVIRQMSEAYVSGRAAGKDVFEIPPWPVRDDEGRILDDDINEGHDADG